MSRRKEFKINPRLTSGISQIMNAATENSGAMLYEAIPLDQLQLDEENPRELNITLSDVKLGLNGEDPEYSQKKREIDELQSLAHSIKEHGLINPILVYKVDGMFIVLAGERRALASLLAKKSTIKANILEGRPTDFKRTILQWAENIERKDLSLYERMNNLRKIVECYHKIEQNDAGKTNATAIKNLIGCSLQQATLYHSVLYSQQKLLDAIKVNEVNSLKKAALIAKAQSVGEYEELLSASRNNESLQFMQRIAKEARAAQKKERQAKARQEQGRGRKATQVNLGNTKSTKSVKAVVDAVLNQDRFAGIKSKLLNVNWSDFRTATDAFKVMLKHVESIVGDER